MRASQGETFSLAAIFFGPFANLFRRRRAARAPGRRLHFEPLEPRFLLSADPIGAAAPDAAEEPAPPAVVETLAYTAAANGAADSYTLRFNAQSGDLELLDGTSVVLSRSLASTTGVVINGEDGQDDTLTIDLAFGGLFSVPGGITYNGGAGGVDTLIVTGGEAATATHSVTATGPGLSGNIVYDYGASPALAIAYTDLEPVLMDGPANIVLALTGLDDQAVLEDDGTAGNGFSRLRSLNGLFEETIFRSNTLTSLTINMDAGNDSLSVTSLPDFAGSLTVNGQGGGDTVGFAGTTSFTALTVIVSGAITDVAGATLTVGGNLSFTGTSITLTDSATDVLSVGNSASFTATGGAITIAAAGTANFGSLTFNATGAVSITEDSAMVLSGSSTGGSATLRSSATISVNGTLRTTGSAGSGAVVLQGGGSTVILNADIVTAGAAITIEDSVILGNAAAVTNVTLDTTNGGAVAAGANVTITGPVNDDSGVAASATALTVRAGTAGDVNLQGAVGGTTAIRGLSVISADDVFLPSVTTRESGITVTTNATEGSITLSGDLDTNAGALSSGVISLFGPITLATDVDIDVFDSNVLLSGSVNSDATARQLHIETGFFGNITFAGAVGATNPLASLSAISGSIGVTSDVTTIGGQFYSNLFVAETLTLGATGPDGSITIDGNLQALDESLTMSAREIDFTGGPSFIMGTSHLFLLPEADDTPIIIGGTFDAGAASLDLTDEEIAGLSGFSLITIGRPSGTATLTVDSSGASFNNALSLRASGDGGAIVIDGELTTTNAFGPAALALTAGDSVDINGALTTAGGNVTVIGVHAVRGTGTGSITTTAVADSGSASGEVRVYSGSFFGPPVTPLVAGVVELAGDIDTSGADNDLGAGSSGAGVQVFAQGGSITVAGVDTRGGSSIAGPAGAGGEITIQGGEITLNGSVHSGTSLVSLEAPDGVFISAGATLNVDLANTLRFTRFEISDQVTVDGTLHAELVDGFAPTIGDRFEFMTFGSSFDFFAATVLPGDFTVDQHPTHLDLVFDTAPAPTISIGNAVVTEGNSGTVDAAFNVTLSSPSTQTITVDYVTADVTAVAGGDYNAATGTLTFSPGQTSQQIFVTVNGDLVDEPDEFFLVGLSNAVNGSISSGLGAGFITDDDAAPMISIGNAVVTEGNTGTRSAVFNVSLSAASAAPITVDFATSDGTALAGADYAPLVSSLFFAAGETDKQIFVTVNGDLIDENDETFNVTLFNPVNAVIAAGVGTGVITDDDGLVVSIGDAEVIEGDSGSTLAFIRLTLSAPSAVPIAVSYVTVGGTATIFSDFAASNGAWIFNPGETEIIRTPGITGDTIYEADETFFIELLGANDASIGDGHGVITILNDDPLPTILISDATVTEGDGGTMLAVFTLSLSAASSFDATVDFATADGTARAGEDYVSLVSSVHFAAGETSAQVSVEVIGDVLDEFDETFELRLTGSTNSLIADNGGVGTIEDDDPEPTISVTDAVVIEGDRQGGGTAEFDVTLSSASTKTITVQFATADGTALAGIDYGDTMGVLTFAPGETSKRVSIGTIGDLEDERDETFFLNLSAAVNASIADGQGQGLIRDDETAISIGDASVPEGFTHAVFEVTLAEASPRSVSVEYVTADGTAVRGRDYHLGGGVIAFAPGETTRQIFVEILDDALDETDETFTVTLSNAIDAFIADGEATGTIRDDDPAPTISMAANTAIFEGDTGTTVASFFVSLSAASEQTVTVHFATADGSALAGSDYDTASGTLTFAPGEMQKEVPVTVNGDLLDEPDETFFLRLSDAINGTIVDAAGTGMVTILDDDPLPAITIGNATVIEGDSGTTLAVFDVSLSNASAFTVTVDYVTADVTAAAGDDYNAAAGTLTFAPGETSQQLLVTVNADLVDEPDEFFLVGLSNAVNGSISSGIGAGFITDDDAAPAISIGNAVVTEGNTGTTNAAFNVTLSNASAQTVSVNYATADGTALAGADYVSVPSGMLTFAPGETSKQIFVTVNADLEDEADETFDLNLSNAINASIDDGVGLGTILDDDANANQAPVFVEIGPRSVEEGRELRFIVSATDADDAANTLTFTAGPLPAGASFNAAAREFVWVPLDDATTAVTFTVTDPDGAADTMQVMLTATNVAPEVDAGADQVVGLQNVDDKHDDKHDHKHDHKHGKDKDRPEAEVSIAAVFDDLGVRDTHTATINWGDGTSSPGMVVEPSAAADGTVKGTHTYTKAGTYTVTVTVRDDDGGVTSDTLVIEVKKPVEKKNFESRKDEYKLDEDTVLRVNAANGVLGNDRGPGGATLLARVVEGPEHGRLVFNANGSFVYTPDRDFHGKDSFWYEFTDGSNVSRAVEVKLSVKDVKDKRPHHPRIDWHGSFRDDWSDCFQPAGHKRWR